MRRSLVIALLLVLCVGATNFLAYADETGGRPANNAGLSVAPAPSIPAGAGAAAPASSSDSRVAIGVGVKFSTLGIGGEVAVPVSHRSNLRAGFNLFNYSDTFNKDGVTYKGTLNFRSAQATYDFFPIGSFHVSPGVLFYNGNQVTANASVPGGQTLTLNNNTYFSDAANPVTGTGKLTVYKAAPMLLFGFGNLVPRSHHFSTTVEIGAAYQGPPRVNLALIGSVCDSTGLNCRAISSDPTVQSNIVAEQDKLNKSASPFRFYPVLSFGFGYKF